VSAPQVTNENQSSVEKAGAPDARLGITFWALDMPGYAGHPSDVVFDPMDASLYAYDSKNGKQ
jgi:hypothetical protein